MQITIPSRFRNRLSVRALLAMGAVLWLAGTVSSQAGLDIFMKLQPLEGQPSVVGESTDEAFRGGPDGYFRLNDVDVAFQNVTSSDSNSSGAAVGKVSFLALAVNKALDSASPAIFQLLASGQHFQSATIVIRRAGANPNQTFMKLEFQDVSFVSQNWNAESGANAARETLRISYTGCRISYRPTQATGKLGREVVNSWDLTTNAPIP